MTVSKKRSRRKNSTRLVHAFADKLEWQKVHDTMNATSDIKHSSLMSTRNEFIVAMKKLAKHAIINILNLEEYSDEDVYKLAVSEDFNEMIYEALLEKK